MQRLSQLASSKTPFIFYTNFDASETKVFTLDELKNEDIEFSFEQKPYKQHSHSLVKYPLDFNTYKKDFDSIIEKIKAGETYLLNYTCSTPIQTKLSLKEIYACSNAAFKLRVKNSFVCFSPERFIKIQDDFISTYPMKGTIDASIDNAQEKILASSKETAEHVMVVDLLRNDLSMVSKNVQVSKFRYIEKIKAGDKELLQVSSQIQGKLEKDWKNNLGNILKTLLPAGSITGTPKKRTIEIIKNIESHQRGHFTGIFGYFDGENFDSAVMIRFIENKPWRLQSNVSSENKPWRLQSNISGEAALSNKPWQLQSNVSGEAPLNHYIYKSGGGITLESNAKDEYQEMLDKIYIP